MDRPKKCSQDFNKSYVNRSYGDSKEEFSFDTVCAICDNGGDLLCCEGSCLRSFHPTKDSGAETDCMSLGYSSDQIEAIQNFFCKNCRYKQHQCFACGKLGSSNKYDGAEVFPCANAKCGHFYHPNCVAKFLFSKNEVGSTDYQKMIASGKPFTCPAHKCAVCKQGENKQIFELQFAMCRRCPVSYHRRCLPKEISFENLDTSIQRAWDNLLPNRILIYCMRHELDAYLETPLRNHIIFPCALQKRVVLLDNRKSKLVSDKKLVSGKFTMEQKPLKISGLKQNDFLEKYGDFTTNQMVLQKKAEEATKTISPADPEKVSLSVKPKRSMVCISSSSAARKLHSSFPVIDAETKERIKNLVNDVSSSLTMEDIAKELSRATTHTHSVRETDKSITEAKLEVSIEAVKMALKKVEEGNSIVDAKAVCEPGILQQIIKWRKKLKVYLSPFLHGMRYTSFGRHFTKVDKLTEIADRLQWYINSGDTVVDFCCGANDFSRLMREKLDAAGKKCSYKNYDLIPPKNDFNFEQRDWMTVQPDELPDGSRLIMGLNPPFGDKAFLANTFIDKALSFLPKLIILIVPEETERLDKKHSPYDLIWKDRYKFSGKSFYLPGSIDVDGNQMEQWNLKPPPLYLWSRPDWTEIHRNIALQKGHILNEGEFYTEVTQMNCSPHDYYEYEKTYFDSGDECAPPECTNILKGVNPRKRLKQNRGLETIETDKLFEMSNVLPNDMDGNENSLEVHNIQEPLETFSFLTCHLGSQPVFDFNANSSSQNSIASHMVGAASSFSPCSSALESSGWDSNGPFLVCHGGSSDVYGQGKSSGRAGSSSYARSRPSLEGQLYAGVNHSNSNGECYFATGCVPNFQLPFLGRR